MTLEELKAYKVKCEEVQNTIKRDIAYIEKSNKEEEDTIIRRWGDFVHKIVEVIECMPSEEDLLREGNLTGVGHIKDKSVDGDDTFYSVVCGLDGRRFCYGDYEIIGRYVDFEYYTLKYAYEGKKVRIYENGNVQSRRKDCMVHSIDLCNEYDRKDVLEFMAQKDNMYAIAKQSVVCIHERLNKRLVERNKKVLAKAEHLKD